MSAVGQGFKFRVDGVSDGMSLLCPWWTTFQRFAAMGSDRDVVACRRGTKVSMFLSDGCENSNRLALNPGAALNQAPAARLAIDENPVEPGANTRNAEGEQTLPILPDPSRHTAK